jgi:hypothetical protein
VLIPAGYVADLGVRLGLYPRIAALAAELIERDSVPKALQIRLSVSS